jgi:glycosyltransferase involved in cell wall biosynthesis
MLLDDDKAQRTRGGTGGRSEARSDLARRKIILLFYKEVETDKYFKHDRYLKRVVRPLYELTHHRQKKTGFAVSFELLRRALDREGWDVRVNDYGLARKNPGHPVGLIGYPTLLANWTLPNPAILGPSLYDHPMLAPRLMEDERFKTYLVLGQWTKDMFHPFYGEACVRWHAGIDTEVWGDTSSNPKDVDFLIYDKIRWDHERLATELLEPIRRSIESRGLRTQVLRYKYHDHITYRRMLRRSRAMLFLCEHETQGLAYQEALASNIPVLAWDNGFWLDPLWRRLSPEKIPASSVPFFSTLCGERFADLDGFEPALRRFLDRFAEMNPRKYVLEHLSMRQSAEIYAREYMAQAS